MSYPEKVTPALSTELHSLPLGTTRPVYALLPFLFLAGRKVGKVAGATGAMLDSEVTLELEASYGRAWVLGGLYQPQFGFQKPFLA